MSSQASRIKLHLHAKQGVALESLATEILYGGSVGGGKSFLMRAAAIMWCGMIPGLQVYLFRRLRDDLVKNHIEGPKGLRMLLAPWARDGLVDIVEDEIRFWNGAKIYLCHCKDEKDRFKYLGAEIHVLCIDELTTFSETIYRFLRSRVRMVGIKLPPEFVGRFPRIVCGSNPGNIGHCVPFGEVLTPAGWRDIREMAVGDAVFTVAATGEMQTTTVAQVHSQDYSGELVHLEARALSVICTPNHQMAKVGGTKRKQLTAFSLVPFTELPGQAVLLQTVKWVGTPLGEITPDRYPTRARKLSQPTSLSGELYCELLGWLLSEGSVVDCHKAFAIAQMKPAGREAIHTLLELCGFKASWGAKQVIVHAADWWAHFRSMGDSRQKSIPPAVKGATAPELERLLFALMAGDGHWRKEGAGSYYTISRKLADDVTEVALKLGYVVYQSSRQKKNRRGLAYTVSIRRSKRGGSEILTGQHCYSVTTTTKKCNDIQREHFTGKVYCLGINRTHTFIIRQKGSVWVSGNSWVKAAFIDPREPLAVERMPDDEGAMLRQYIPAKLEDNPSMAEDDPGYAGKVSGLGNPELVRAMRDGDWNVVAGAFFPEISTDVHVVTPRSLPAYWLKFRSFDWGSARPFSVGWWAVSDGELVEFPRGAIIRYREWYGAQRDSAGRTIPNTGLRMTAEQVADGIVERERGDVTGPRTMTGVADPSIFAEDGGPSIADRMTARKVFWRPADNTRVGQRGAMGGWDQVRARLIGDGERPALYVFSTCLDWIRTMPALQHDDGRPEDVQTEGEDHIADETRYACLSRPYVAPLPPGADDPEPDRYARRWRPARSRGGSAMAA